MTDRLTGRDVRTRVFTARTRYGMDPDEVLPFVGMVASELDRLHQTLTEVRADLAERENEPVVPTELAEAEKTAYSLLRSARLTADQTVAEAEATADRLRAATLAGAKRVTAVVNQRSERTLAEATAAAEEIVATARAQAAALRDESEADAAARHQAVATRERHIAEREEAIAAEMDQRAARLRAAGEALSHLADAVVSDPDPAMDHGDDGVIDVRKRRAGRLLRLHVG